jgi:NAD+ synthase
MSTRQGEIAAALGVTPAIDGAGEIARRTGFLAEACAAVPGHALVLGISGGIDSAVAGILCARACRTRQARGAPATFVAMRLPYGAQRDADDAAAVLDTLAADRTLSVDVAGCSDALMGSVAAAGLKFADASAQDAVAANVRARERMVTQYAVANAVSGLVVGTDQAAEEVMGFYTKYGDGAADVTPLSGLTKRQVRALAEKLGVPEGVITKPPTADLEVLRPQRADEDAFGIGYDEIDDYLEGRAVSPEVIETVESAYHRSAHKRSLPRAPRPAGH